MKKVFTLLVFLAFLAWAPALSATELVWQPVNPSFGGNPLNGTFLLNQAEAQNHFPEPTASYSSSALDDFEESLTRRILSELASQIVSSAFGTSETEIGSGFYEFGNYQIEITSTEGESINVEIVDTLTGQSTTVEVPYY